MTCRRRRAGALDQRGVALLLAVWLLALLAAIAGEFVVSGRVRAIAESNKRDELRALALAQAGYRAALAALDASIAGVSLDADGGLLLLYDQQTEATPALAEEVALGDGKYSWRVVAEDGLVNLNDLQLPRSAFVGLLEECGMQPGVERDSVVDSILDWRDTNREHRLNGAEEDYYRGLEPPYSCKDGPFDVVEELLLVRGVTPALFNGAEVDGRRRVPGLRDLVSVHARGATNLWTAPRGVLEALGKARPAGTTAPGPHYSILATGSPGGGAPARTLRAIVERTDKDGSWTFTLLYWNDNFLLPREERGGH